MEETYLADVVNKLLEQTELSYAQIARKARLPSKNTISNWANGYSKKPRDWRDLVRFARALNLTEAGVNELLRAGGHETIAYLGKQVSEEADQELLAYWQNKPDAPFNVPPLNVNEIIGRQSEQAEIRQAFLGHNSICALVGMGGIGKSILAQYMGYQLRPHFPDGVLWMRVNGETSLMGILHALAAFYGRDVSQYSELDTRAGVVRDLLANKQALLILDNIESSTELNTLLPPGGACAVLITTRNHQAISGRLLKTIKLSPLANDESRQLLISYIGQERVEAEAAGVRELIDFVAGLPLALCVIGGALKQAIYITLHEYAEMLEDERQRLMYLEDSDDASKNVRACFELSYKRLSSGEQDIFAHLAVFPALDFSLAAVAAITGTPLPQAALHLGRLAALSLIDHNLTRKQNGQTVAAERTVTERYQLHLLLHLFAQEKMGERLPSLRQRAADYFTEFAQHYGTSNRYDWLDLEWVNITAALRWAHYMDMPAVLQRGVDGLTHIHLGVIGYLESRGYWRQAQELLQWVRPTVEPNSLAEAHTLLKLGAFYYRLADYEQAEQLLTTCKAIVDKLSPSDDTVWLQAYLSEFLSRLKMTGDPEVALDTLDEGIKALEMVGTPPAKYHQGYLHLIKSEVFARGLGMFKEAMQAAQTGLDLLPTEPTSAYLTGLTNLGVIHAIDGDLAQSNDYINKAIPMAEALGDARRLATLFMNRAINAQKDARLQEARSDLERACDVFQGIGDADQAGSVWVNLGMIHTIWGNDAEAIRCLHEALALAEQFNIPNLAAYAKTTLVRPYLHRGEIPKAIAAAAEARDLCRQYSFSDLSATALMWQAWLAHSHGDGNEGHQLMNQAVTLAQQQHLTQEEGMARSLLGRVLDANQSFEEARKSHEQALAILVDQDRYELSLAQLALIQHYLDLDGWPLSPSNANLLATARANFTALQARRELALIESLIAQS